MDIEFKEGILLSLYLEFFNHCYDTEDKREYDKGKEILVRHVEMQNITFILQNLGIINDGHSFMWDWSGPFSSGLQVILNKLDKKVASIKEFYESYNKNRNIAHYVTYEEQLKGMLFYYFRDNDIEKISKVISTIEGILKEERGSEILVDIIYIGKNILPSASLSEIIEYMKEKECYINIELIERIWEALAVLGIRQTAPKKFTRERTLKDYPKGLK